MPFVPGDFQLHHIPLLDGGWHFGAIEIEVVGAHAGEQFALRLTFPVFELPLVTVDKNCNDTLPPGLCEVLHVVINLESVLLVTNLALHLC